MTKLLGADLDLAVAQALGLAHEVEYQPTNPPKIKAVWLTHKGTPDFENGLFNPSLDANRVETLQMAFSIAVYPDTSVRAGDDRWVAGFDIDVEEDPDVCSLAAPSITLCHESRGPTPTIAVCRAIVARHEAEEARQKDVRDTAWHRAEVARQTRVPFTNFANDEERRAYGSAMDQQLRVVQSHNPELYPSPYPTKGAQAVQPGKELLPPCPCHGPLCMHYPETDGVQCMKKEA